MKNVNSAQRFFKLTSAPPNGVVSSPSKKGFYFNSSELLKLMEEDLSYTTAQIDVENFNILSLGSKDIAFICNLEKGESDASNVATGYQQSVSKEIAVLSKLQAVEAANVELLEELSNVKREVAELENRLKKAKESLR